MSRDRQQLVFAALAALGGVAVLVAAGWLTADALAALRRAPDDLRRVNELLESVRKDAAYASTLQTEYDLQTQQALRRDARSGVLAKVLLAASVLFLVSVKRFVALRPPKPIRAPSASAGPGATAVPAVGEKPTALPLPVVEPVDLSPVDDFVIRLGRQPSAAIPILQAIQAHYRYLPEAALRRVCELTEITPAQLTGVASFYKHFRHTPIGEHVVTVCHGTACHVAGAGHIDDELRRRLQLAPGQDTDTERCFTVETVPCLGCCTLAPVVQFDGVTRGHLQADDVPGLLESCRTSRKTSDGAKKRRSSEELVAYGGPEIRLGLGSCCLASGSGGVYDALRHELADAGINATVKRVGCVGMCHQMPLVEIHAADRPPVLYSHVQPDQARALVWRHLRPAGFVRRLRGNFVRTVRYLRNRQAAPVRPLELRDPPIAAFLDRQKRIATEHCGDLDPLNLDEYLAHGGFQALERCRDLTPEQLIEQIRVSGVRGRGGAGYPTWQKWAKVRQAAGDLKYVICNGDEGDPGAFMDRMIMESYPYRVLEGMAIAAHAVGATEAHFFIRAEYPLAVERISAALRHCEERGLLRAGDQPLRVHVVQGAGAFVCGEETALIATLEGQRGVPRLRPPYPAEHGLWGRPTLVNNVETFAVLPWILRYGPDAFAALGTLTSKGTKVFALAGKVRRGGLIEVPMGMTIREIVEGIGGGVREEQTAAGPRCRTFKAVQIGGPSGGCIPAELADTPVDYEVLAGLGAIMGSGGLVVLDDRDCMVDIARYFLNFTQDQSCGKCAPCRIGTRRMLEILDRLCSGTGRREDLEILEQLARLVSQGSLCGLGKTAPNPVLTTLRYFRAEYEAHVVGRCPAGKCQALIAYTVTDACTGCTLCAQHCPVGAIAPRPYEQHEIDLDKCTRCDACIIRCPEDAIRIVDARHSDESAAADEEESCPA
jgi:NADH:ubiquinone oxidoreductase subunit F (NADH-binding)/NADH:ubiquinone oxidoreductase subunit E/Pyruvate/2-oxoacid:ferredoxin oxidoreductase delta subunit